MNKHYSLLASSLLAISTLSFGVVAAVSPEKAAELGKSLTPLGAEMAGNADGTIPPWTGGLTQVPASYQGGTALTDPFADEKPLFTISAANVDQYQDKLTPGQVALLKKYPDTLSFPVYQTHRTVALPQFIYDYAKENATKAQLVSGGNGIAGVKDYVPFPIPNNAVEIVWNHITRYRGGSVERTSVQAPVLRNGDYTPIKAIDRFVWPTSMKEPKDDKKDDNVLFYYTLEVLEPSRLTGNVLLVHETMDQVKEARRAWVYNAGQRRVRRAPQVAYDGPGFAADGQRTSDQLDMYNGAPDKYNWELKGKQELYIPYNAFRLANKELSYDDILLPGHLNPEHLRYELHRVWVVEGTVKDDERHVYAKRTIYVDEDSWQAAVIDHYDARGELWRVQEAHELQYYNVTVPWMAAEVLHDLTNGRYMALGLTNEEKVGLDFDFLASRRDFTTSALRRKGKR
ncbi:DUF1329 domain-containing protein [Ferrimonas aestuarii]|uniref:DUF1329 domain-containing protein n=1 Tax=Ferrimonas aestuarii TaxID=2569539 RepID=A0A4U1BWE1_9GAMM|nr:DUF1329 domain-containing protein [Ferrimonas aestuarii]TKB57509.1 DUF1329 domain-containing protein [Ferrimonas aestuarii]